MAEELNIVLEHLRDLRERIDTVDEKVTRTDERIIAISHHMAGFMTNLNHQEEEFAKVKNRLDRIEERLGLVEDPH